MNLCSNNPLKPTTGPCMRSPMISTLINTALLLLTALTSALSMAEERVAVIKPDIERSDVRYDRIDSENFEVTFPAVGILSIEDFDTGFIISGRIGYHLNERLFVEASYSLSEGDKTSFEELSPGSTLITDEQRDYKSWDVSLGFNLFPGETWLFGRAYSSDLYTVVGAGRTDFGGSTWTTVNVGVGYRLYLNDWIALRFDLRNHIFNRSIFGEDDSTNNIELSIGPSVFF